MMADAVPDEQSDDGEEEGGEEGEEAGGKREKQRGKESEITEGDAKQAGGLGGGGPIRFGRCRDLAQGRLTGSADGVCGG